MYYVIDKIDGKEIFAYARATEYNGAMYLLNEDDKTAKLLYVKKIKYGLFADKNGVLTIPSTIKAGLKTYTVIGRECAYYKGLGGYHEWHKDGRRKGGGYSTYHTYETTESVSTFGMVEEELKELILPDTWTNESVDISAKNLTAVTLPKSITTIKKYALSGCSSLKTITIPEGVTKIGENAFDSCKSLKTITIPEGVTEIGDSAFYYCECLEKIIIPNTVNRIGDYAFAGCKKLIDITLPESLNFIGKDIFSLGGYKNINYSGPLTPNWGCVSDKIINGIACRCGGKEAVKFLGDASEITIPDNVESIGEKAFEKCENITSVTIGKNVNSIGYRAFSECYGLKRLIIAEDSKLRCINNCAFADCIRLESIQFPCSLTQIGGGIFDGCNSLREIIFENPQLGEDELKKKFGESRVKIVKTKNNIINNEDAKKTVEAKTTTNQGPVDIKEVTEKSSPRVVSIDLEKLIQAALADGIVTDKERSILIKKVKEAGGDVDEFEMLLDARIYEAQQKNGKAKSEPKPAPKPEPKPTKTASEPKTEPKPAAKVSGDFKKSAVSGDYTIGITPENKVVVNKDGKACDNAKGALREISEKVGFEIDPKWNTQQFGSKLVDFLNSK